jgi:hypothetical protein
VVLRSLGGDKIILNFLSNINITVDNPQDFLDVFGRKSRKY